MNITANETAVLSAIALHEFSGSNGHPPASKDEHGGTYCWVNDFASATDLVMGQVKGVLSSLVQKNLIVIDDFDGEDNVVAFTDAGFDAYLANR